MSGDASYASVSLLLHGDGANNSTTFTDNSPTPKTLTATGNAKISTTQSKWGGASMFFDGTGDYLSTPVNVAFDFTQPFTIEGWMFKTGNGGPTLCGIVGNLSDASLKGWRLGVGNTTGAVWDLAYYATDSTVKSVSGAAIAANQWYHFAVAHDGTSLRAFTDGVLNNTTATSLYPKAATAALEIGHQTASDRYFQGHIDDLRITKGVARYTATFTPPAAPFPNGMGEVGGVIRDASGALCSRTVRLIRRDTGAHIISGASDAGTGAYLLATPTLDEVVRIVHSSTTTAPLENDLIDRVIPA